MAVTLDGEALAVGGPTLGDALDAAGRAASQRRRIVVEVLVDGAALADDALAGEARARPIEASDVRLISAEPRALVRGALLEVHRELGHVGEAQRQVAGLARGGHLGETLAALAPPLEAWNRARRVVEYATTMLDWDPGATPEGPGEGTISAAADMLATRLGELKRAIELGDASGLCDSLEYDLPEEAERWRMLLLALAELAGRGASPSAPAAACGGER
ncbi:MAG TPA: hypothetical protein VD963_04085 [Phycisphaerales bacterium]|nr:hypothetical protein [Phycisphaerales bacterium]